MGPTLALIFLFLMPIGCSSQACEVLNKFPKIEENSPVGTLVTEILLGTGYTVNVEPRDTFMMNGSQLQMSREVDFEVDQLVRATLTCNLNEGFAGIEDLVVEILDVNDNECKFKRDNYSFIISEALQVNSSIGNAIEAEDADQDTLYYTLSGNVNSLAYFRLSSETNPVILVNKRLDFDDAPNVNLNLTVRDRLDPTERPIHSATASIMIDIVDVDDKPPFFMPCTAISTKICINYGYTGSVTRTEQETGPLILSPGPIYAVDGDWGIGASVEYSILNGNNDNVFNVHTTSGNITMNKAVNTLGNFILQVMAYQTDDQAKYSTTSVIIEVKEKNNFLPTFEKSIYYGMIPSDSAIGTFVLDLNDRLRTLVVFAADDDFPDKQNPSLVYTIDNSTAFRILRDGYILTDAVITTPGTIVLQVSATDSSTNEKATTLVSVEVIAATTTIPTTTTTTTTTKSPTATNIGTTTTTTPGTGTTTTTTKGTGTTTTSTPGTGTTTTKGTGTTTTPTPGTGTTTTTTKEFTEKALSSYTATDMAALGASLGAILALCLVLLGFLIHKQYGNSIKRKLGRGLGDNSGSPQNSAEQLINDTDDPANDFPDYGGFATTEPVSTSVTIATDAALGSAPSQSDPADNQPSEIVESDDSDDKKVKSILTKELKEDAGYKAVWFREDASPEVVVIEGVEDGEADDYDNEDNFDNQQGDDEDDDDDEEDLDPTFNLTDNQPENSIL
ncbi:cadherin-related family member 5 isoform X4 [Rana temporaria]|uniref:cadherin-related family member 5 isoform X4 n=1 Tax=Rana temporaria TaxID=8407 RepID=UPI001AACE615|nr:cadherin-related family member 5 isoform X4 [Rana temporaria]